MRKIKIGYLAILLLLLSYNLVHGQSSEFDGIFQTSKRMISLQFDNDTYYYTDYYYTYGLEAKLKLPVFSRVPWTGIVPKFDGVGNLTSELILSQRLYTPKNIRDTAIQFNDRPFSATLELDQKFISYHENGTSFISTIRLGIMGPLAGGEAFQKLIHDWINSPDPQGWDYQIKNGVIINYDFLVSYPIIHNESLNLSVLASARVGTLFDDLGAGMNFSFSNFRKANREKVRYYVALDAMTELVGYNALLQGGLFTENDPYVLTYNQITPIVFKANMTIGISWYGVGLSIGHNYLSREFDSGTNHNYSSVKLSYQF